VRDSKLESLGMQNHPSVAVGSFLPIQRKFVSKLCPDTPSVYSFRPYHSSTVLPKRKFTKLLVSSENGCAEGDLPSPTGLRALDP